MVMNLTGIKNADLSFRSNIWSWRPIHAIIDFVNEKYSLEIDTENFGFNEGGGIKDPSLCIKLGGCIKKELDELGLKENSDSIYLSLGSWCRYPNGEFIRMDESKAMGLNEYSGKVLLTPVATSNGTLVVPSHSTDKKHIEEFCSFLNECGGFEIW